MNSDATHDFQRTKWFEELSPLERLEVAQTLIARQQEDERRARAKLIEDLRASASPVPDHLKSQIDRLHIWDIAEVLRHHPGADIAGRFQSYQTALRVFEDASRDLLGAIESFDRASAAAEFHQPNNRTGFNEAERRVQKELFATANAAHALVDHCRRLNTLAKSPEYAPRLKAAFGNDGLHEFVVELRNVLHHFHMIEASWHFREDFRDRSRVATFTVPKGLLIAAFQQNDSLQKADRTKTLEAIMAYLAHAPDDIDLRVIFPEYQRRSATFHEWLRTELSSASYADLRDYEDCVRRNRRFGARQMWAGVIGNCLHWKTPPNPYDHLHKFLTTDELAIVTAMERGSRAQIDKIIEFVDTDGACDSTLRQTIYAWFSKSLDSEKSRSSSPA